MKQRNDRKIQREYFERQRKAAKISKIKSELAEKENNTNKAISQDLQFLYPLPGREYSGLTSLYSLCFIQKEIENTIGMGGFFDLTSIIKLGLSKFCNQVPCRTTIYCMLEGISR